MGMLLERFQVPMLFVFVLCIFIATAVSFETQRVTLDVQESLVSYYLFIYCVFELIIN